MTLGLLKIRPQQNPTMLYKPGIFHDVQTKNCTKPLYKMDTTCPKLSHIGCKSVLVTKPLQSLLITFTVGQVAPSWCLLSSAGQFWSGIPKSHLPEIINLHMSWNFQNVKAISIDVQPFQAISIHF